MTAPQPNVYAGIDTHQNTNHVGIINEVGKKLADKEFPTTSTGYQALLDFVLTFGTIIAIGIEGTASYGAGITAYLRTHNITVKEVIRPNRQTRRGGKSDPIDAYSAAKTVAADGDDLPVPKLLGGAIDGIRMLLKARTTAMKARTAATTQIIHFLTTAPAVVREQYAGLTGDDLHAALIATQPVIDDHLGIALRRLSLRIEFLTDEIDTAYDQLDALTKDVAPALAAAKGIGPVSAARLLVTAGENPERITSKAAFAALCGTSPLQASSGKTNRHRLNRGGDRQANSALYDIVKSRMSNDPRTKEYVARRIAEGKTKKESMRCLKRYVANEVYSLITDPPAVPTIDDLRPLRKSRKITLKTVAEYFSTWETTISRLERGLTRNDELADEYRKYLLETV
ncbi:IS110 family transposase [Brevibacterium spongiae]|uniref:IS110 family transposase n=1 Tax=Brevibacterium spongiae TaxID=2909672 RepID=A0ABY5SM39_9MICO|nr:IS110 family transposase [Brevibacterium spongiae]UVI35527.1 IS110 family transposase [Brevibacterium spongiae]UVI35692.1 IS110 family transposase [Brevibacterium spongiae]